MSNLDAELAYFRRKLYDDLDGAASLPSGAIEQAVRFGPFSLQDRQQRSIIRELEATFTTTQTLGASVKSDYNPWLQGRKASIDFFYWKRLARYYIDGGFLPASVVPALDRVTDEVLDYCGNPEDQASWSRRGMVMGHVQSGKTTNYAALICKAADAGYKVIILLAGITNLLRAQTQVRLDETFIGKVSIFSPTASRELTITKFSPEQRFPAYGTSRDHDFSKTAASTYGVTLAALKEPIIFVTKKNRSTLNHLRDWLHDQNLGNLINEPLLLVDDEADNASINTSGNEDQATAINRAIRQILGLFKRSSYIGYTATPFANIFIDPDTEDEMLKDDLFPRHFIKALDPPSNYVGASRIFDAEGDLNQSMIRVIDDYEDILPLKHKIDHHIARLPPSMEEAIRVFLLARAVRIIRGQAKSHCSMLINASRFNDIQASLLGLVYSYLLKLRDSLTVNGGLPRAMIRDERIEQLSADFDREFGDTGHQFDDILKVLSEAANTVEVTSVNMRGGSLDYYKNADQGSHVIAIGGLALSRGLTLEGLTVSYILRNTGASDTLMQMARWFGYRSHYEDICRLYLPQSSLFHYEYITESIEELRLEVKRMEMLGETPADFGLKVRQCPTALRITAANKMRSASAVTLAGDYSGRHIEGYVLYNSDRVNKRNLKAVSDFLQPLGACKRLESGAGKYWLDIEGSKILALLRRFEFPPQHHDLGWIENHRSLLGDYISDRIQNELSTWDVVIPHLKKEKRVTSVFGMALSLRSRMKGSFDDEGLWRATRSKNRIADPSDARLLLSKGEIAEAINDVGSRGDTAFCRKRAKPLLIIHIIGNTGSHREREFEEPVVSLSFCLPLTNIPAEAREYRVNSVFRKQWEDAIEQDDDAEAMCTDDR